MAPVHTIAALFLKWFMGPKIKWKFKSFWKHLCRCVPIFILVVFLCSADFIHLFFYLRTGWENQLFCLWSVWLGTFISPNWLLNFEWTEQNEKWIFTLQLSGKLKPGIMKAKFLYSSNWRLQISEKKKANTIIQSTVNVVHTDI